MGRRYISRVSQTLEELLGRGKVVVLTGAGVSTASGIPDYRDDEGAWKHKKPMEFREFTGSVGARRRYWARSLVGFSRLGRARPNAAHTELAALERAGVVDLVITQNVDGLHQAAGSKCVVDLHGRIDRVVCLGCRATFARRELQAKLEALNPQFQDLAASTTPDGDAELGDVDYSAFRLIDCTRCGGILKPDVVFFGENVPRIDVDRGLAALEAARSLLIVGSSLMVFSGFRFARAAHKNSLPIAVVNRGRTRADDMATFKLAGEAGEILARAAASLTCPPGPTISASDSPPFTLG
jgi:NAD-dependent SIR2 family protein deacetylase